MTWDEYTRTTIDAASNVTSWGFRAVKSGTRLGFAVTRGVTSTAVGATATLIDYGVFGGVSVARPIVGGAVSTVLSVAEAIAMAPIFVSEYITSTSLLAAHSSINVIATITGSSSSEAAFSLTSFITLVKRELKNPPAGNSLPARNFGITQIARAIVAWVALQGVTQEWEEKRWLKSMREIPVKDVPKSFESIMRARRGSRIRVTSDIIFPNHGGQIVTADIGEANPLRAQSFFTMGKSVAPMSKRPTIVPEPRRLTNTQLKITLRRLSKLVLAGYGGASLLFFGVSLTSPHGATSSNSASEKAVEEANLAHAIDASEAEAAGEFSEFTAPSGPGDPQYSWWDVLLGKHDEEIFERYANAGDKADAEIKEKMRATAKIGAEHLMPRFWVLTDHSRAQIVLVLRGTFSLNEVAADLTCEEEEFVPATTPPQTEEDIHHVPGRFVFPGTKLAPMLETAETPAAPRYYVHGGMLRMARAMGGVGKPVQLAVHEALHHNPDYDLVMAGHSLGAGVAGLLGMMWSDPKTCLTIPASGLPLGRRVSVYCFGPPSLVDSALGKVSERLITSFVYSHDVVSRLSLGAVHDLGAAAMWLCDGETPSSPKTPNAGDGAGYSTVTSRAKRWKAGTGTPDDPDWFISVRKTLEANMHSSNMVPPGRVLWALRDNDFTPAHQQTANSDSAADKLRLFEVMEPDKVFSQIIFARDMLSAHMPHQYDQALHTLL
uniref:sn-1-specific diacylglycerol lipase n=1 Tax=Mycena chlorophos TaxID=658473 RepID=A0ABQ0L4S5_MYCCL|nr:lipase class 3 [Mycena chlorophos]